MYIDNIFSIGCQSQMMTPNDQNLTIQSGGNNFFLVGWFLLGWFRPIQEFSITWSCYHYRWRTANWDPCPVFIATEQWSFFSQVSIPINERWAVMTWVCRGHIRTPNLQSVSETGLLFTFLRHICTRLCPCVARVARVTRRGFWFSAAIL